MKEEDYLYEGMYLDVSSSLVARRNSILKFRLVEAIRNAREQKKVTHTNFGINSPSSWRWTTGTSMAAAIISSTFGIATTSRRALNIDYPGATFACR